MSALRTNEEGADSYLVLLIFAHFPISSFLPRFLCGLLEGTTRKEVAHTNKHLSCTVYHCACHDYPCRGHHERTDTEYRKAFEQRVYRLRTLSIFPSRLLALVLARSAACL